MSSLAIDTETTGLDIYHGSRPYLIITCDNEGQQHFWPEKYHVDPLTRIPVFPQEDLDEFKEYALSFDTFYFVNPTFDVTVLYHAGCKWIINEWHRIRDVGLAAHLVCSADKKKDLTTLTLKYLGVDIGPYEERLKKATQKAQGMIRRNEELDNWRIIRNKDGKIVYDPMMPSNKGGSSWKADMWVIENLADHLKYPQEHPWRSLILDYALADPAVTLPLGKKLERILREKKLWKIYKTRLELLRINHEMQFKGITYNGNRLEELATKYDAESKKLGKKCVALAKSVGCDLILPKSGNNDQLVDVVFGENGFKLKPVSYSKKTGKPELNKKVIETLLADLSPRSKGFHFIKALGEKRSRDTASGTYLKGYRKHALPAPHSVQPESRSFARAQVSRSEQISPKQGEGSYVLHPSLNCVGTATLRWSSSNPNSQNISKKESFNLRYTFGPAPGREWWSIDANNIELRIPGYESGEPLLIELFESPTKPPYYGSEHLLNFSTVYPDIWERAVKEVGEDKAGPYCKDKYKSTWYQWCKNGGFAVGYGAIDLDDVEGTADKAFHKLGSHKLLKSRFSMKEKLNQYYIDYANKHGYVETLPDKFVDPLRGYPLYCTRNERGKIKPTVPLNYHVQGTAMWWMQMAMIRSSEYLNNLNLSRYGVNTLQLLADPKLSYMPTVGFFLIGQIHDELLFDFPIGRGPKPYRTNLPKIRKIKGLLELGGEGIGIPTPCSVEYHDESWSKGETIAV